MGKEIHLNKQKQNQNAWTGYFILFYLFYTDSFKYSISLDKNVCIKKRVYARVWTLMFFLELYLKKKYSDTVE